MVLFFGFFYLATFRVLLESAGFPPGLRLQNTLAPVQLQVQFRVRAGGQIPSQLQVYFQCSDSEVEIMQEIMMDEFRVVTVMPRWQFEWDSGC